MKIKYSYIKNPILQMCLALLITSCGGSGGGGGSSAPRSVAPTKMIPNPQAKNPQYDKELPESSEGNNIYSNLDALKNSRVIEEPTGKFPSLFAFEKPAIPQVETKGNDLIVGILDSNFLTHRDALKKKYGDKIIILDKDENNYTDHGELVLDTLLKGISPTMVAASLSSKYDGQNIIKFSLDDYKKILEEMKKGDSENNKKVKIFNQSWGSTFLSKDEEQIYSNKETFRTELLKAISMKTLGDVEEIKKSGQESLDFYEKTVNDENGLFIWANGNLDLNGDTLFNAGLQAAAPMIKRRIEKGWISVVGVDGNDNNNNYYPKHLAYAGVARNWSISANGNAGEKYGSSFAAPRVANAAIQVASKFPWMSNNDIRMTLFTTTNKVGVGDGIEEEKRFLESEASYRNGWGVLNTARALKGPGAFLETLLRATPSNLDTTDWNYYFNANIPENTTSYFENNIHGDSGLKKKGKGTLVLTGDNNFWKKSKIEDGTLEIYRRHASGINIGKEGTLVLHNDSIVGYIQYSKDNEVFYPVANEGNLKLTGNRAFVGEYQNNGGTLTLPQGAKLTVLNDANINNLAVTLEANDYISSIQEKSEILEAKNIVGEIGNININGMRTVSLEKSQDKLVASIARENAVTYLGEAGESSKNTAEKMEATLKELDEKYQKGTLTADEKELGNTILTMSNDTFKTSTEIVSGEIYASAQALNFIQAQNINTGISNHLATLKDFYESDFNWQGWASFQGSHGKFRKDGYASANTEISGGHFGLDRRLGNSQIGAAISYSNGSADFNRFAGKYKSDSIGLSLYAKNYLEYDSYILSRIGVTNFDTEVNRSLLAQDGSLQSGKIKHNDTMYSTYLEVGKDFKYVTPYLGYSLDILDRDGFSENSASWGIVAKDKRYIQQNIIFGLRSDYKVNDTLKLTSHINQQINIGDRDLSFKGHFNNSSTEHTFKGINQIKNTTWVGVGIEKSFSESFGIGANLDIRFDEFKKGDSIISTNLYYRF